MHTNKKKGNCSCSKCSLLLVNPKYGESRPSACSAANLMSLIHTISLNSGVVHYHHLDLKFRILFSTYHIQFCRRFFVSKGVYFYIDKLQVTLSKYESQRTISHNTDWLCNKFSLELIRNWTNWWIEVFLTCFCCTCLLSSCLN